MGIRTGLEHGRTVTVAVLLATVWTLVVAAGVATAFDWTNVLSGSFVGQNATAGAVGVVVLATAFVLLVHLFGETGEEEPAPEAWPPE